MIILTIREAYSRSRLVGLPTRPVSWAQQITPLLEPWLPVSPVELVLPQLAKGARLSDRRGTQFNIRWLRGHTDPVWKTGKQLSGLREAWGALERVV